MMHWYDVVSLIAIVINLLAVAIVIHDRTH